MCVSNSDIDECAFSSDNCDSNAICTNTPGSFTCACSQGYTGDGLTCLGDNSFWYMVNTKLIAVSNSDINECVSSSEICDSNAVCTNTAGSFTCACNQGYTGDGISCLGNHSFWLIQ